jgi:arylsulfatase
MATCVAVADAVYPERFNGHETMALEGESMLPLLRGEPFRKEALFWEHEGNRAVRQGRWKLVCKYPGDWELYDMETDRTELNDLAGRHPDKVEALAALYQSWAERCSVMSWDELLALRKERAAEAGEAAAHDDLPLG